MKLILAIVIIFAGNLIASPPVVEKTEEEARIFTLVDYTPAEISNGMISCCIPLKREDLAIFNTIKRYWERKTGANFQNKTDSKGWGEIDFVVLIKGDRVRFSTTDNSGGSLASGVIINKQQEDSLGIMLKKNGKWKVVKGDGVFSYGIINR
jgi:hypothetical protein